FPRALQDAAVDLRVIHRDGQAGMAPSYHDMVSRQLGAVRVKHHPVNRLPVVAVVNGNARHSPEITQVGMSRHVAWSYRY
ncbi:MAG: hypothetical protein WA884_10660, partial [Methyloceanibacter sp.]